MTRYEIATKKVPATVKPRNRGTLRKCELWKIGKDGITQGTVCYLKSLDKFETSNKYSPMGIKLVAEVPCDFHLPLRGPLLLKLDEDEFRIFISCVKQDYESPKKDTELSGTISPSPVADTLTPAERGYLRRVKFDKLSAGSKNQPLE